MKKYMVLSLVGLLSYQSHAKVLAEGKTKIIHEHPEDNTLVVIESKDDITAHDALKHDVMTGKASLATNTTCNVFRLLKSCNIPITFVEQLDETRFTAQRCVMAPYEVVVRREAHGSMIKRYPYLEKGHVFPQLKVEFFLKTDNKVWQGVSIPKDDPYIRFTDTAELYRPDLPIHEQKPFLTIDKFPLHDKPELLKTMAEIAQKTFLILEKAWQMQGGRLVDFKVEFGFDTDGNLLLADVIDNDSWRVIYDENYIDKQLYRENAQLSQVQEKYRLVSSYTNRFKIPKQNIILWRASQVDDLAPFMQALEPYKNNITIQTVSKSMHKEPIKAYTALYDMLKQSPDTVIISIVGKSNGLGPCLSALTHVPVITVPTTSKEFPEDVWSSLRMPSDVSPMTILGPANAVRAAMQILARNNPAVYAQLRFEQEKRLINIVEFH